MNLNNRRQSLRKMLLPRQKSPSRRNLSLFWCPSPSEHVGKSEDEIADMGVSKNTPLIGDDPVPVSLFDGADELPIDSAPKPKPAVVAPTTTRRQHKGTPNAKA